jgi:hypothetical protein
MLRQAVALLALVSLAYGHQVKIVNGCPFTVWIGTLNNPNKQLPANGGFRLNEWEARSLDVPNEWAGRVWARTGCDANGRCETGDCGGRIECGGNGGTPPVSLAEITFDGWGGIDYYDVSLVDGYNLPVAMYPISGTVGGGGGPYDCQRAGCNKDLNAICPGELQVRNGAGNVIACLSACMKFNTDEYCCRGAHDRPETCKSSDWPVNYPAIFKQACPQAYSYAYDDTSSTFTCKSASSGSSTYEVLFCP